MEIKPREEDGKGLYSEREKDLLEREERFTAEKDHFNSEKADLVADRDDLIEEKKQFDLEKEEFRVMEAKFLARKAAVERGLKFGMSLPDASYVEEDTRDGGSDGCHILSKMAER
jgi:hypothetical protein